MVNAIIEFVRSMFNVEFRFFYVHVDRFIERVRLHDYVRHTSTVDRAIENFIHRASECSSARSRGAHEARIFADIRIRIGFQHEKVTISIEPNIDAPVITKSTAFAARRAMSVLPLANVSGNDAGHSGIVV